jgi:MFS transporter, OPA family, sugar phosphate sensor protein UhpC
MPETTFLEYAAPSRRRGLLGFFATGADLPVLQDPAEVDRRYKRSRIQVMLCIAIGYGLMYTCKLAPGVVKARLMDLHLFNATQIGNIEANLLLGYAFGRLVNGFLADYANLKRFFALGVLLTAGTNLLMGTWHSYWLWSVLWGMNGWFQGFGAPSSIVSVARWFGPLERGRAYGVWSTAHGLGESLTFIGSAALVTYFGWQAAFIGPAALCALVAVAVYIFMLDRPQTYGLPPVADWQEQKARRAFVETNSDRDVAAPSTAEAAPAPRPSIWSQLEILKMPSLWIVCLSSAAMYMTRYAIIGSGTLYLQKARGYTLNEAGSIMSINMGVGMAGCVAYGFISDLVFKGRRPPVTLIFGVLEVASLFAIFFMPPGHPLILTGAFMVYGFTLSGLLAVLGGLFAVDLVPKRAAGLAIGMTGVVSYLGATVQAWVSGPLIDQGHTVVNGVDQWDFSKCIAFWIGASIVSLVLATTLWRAKPQE